MPLCPLQEVRQGRRNVEINVHEGQRATNNNNRRQEGSIFRERKEGGNKFANRKLGQEEADEKNGLSLEHLANSHMGSSSYSSSYMRGKRVVERGKEGKNRWRLFFYYPNYSNIYFVIQTIEVYGKTTDNHLFHHQDNRER